MPDVYFSPVNHLCCRLFVVAEGKLFNDSESGNLLLLFITKSKKNACHSGARGQKALDLCRIMALKAKRHLRVGGGTYIAPICKHIFSWNSTASMEGMMPRRDAAASGVADKCYICAPLCSRALSFF